MAKQNRNKVDHTARLNDQFRVALQEIVDAVEGGDNDGFELPFQAGGRPYNPATGHAATGTNALICLLLGVNYYSTYDGWQKLGYQVPRGQEATLYLARPRKFKIDADKSPTGEDEWRVGGFDSVAVWSYDVVVPRVAEEEAEMKRKPRHPMPAKPWTPPALKEVSEVETIERAEAFIANLGAKVSHTTEGRAFYRPSDDSITMPVREMFSATKTRSATQAYYSVSLHEHAHWTGHKSRCDRLGDKSRRGYAHEELTAEISALILCADLGITATIRPDHIKYIASWLKALDDDKRYIFSAGKLAQDAVEYMHSLQPENQAEAA
tara:strand:+ start:1741 stop:2709 length:969 start_codon:yes stop_codon:yes gene_type:complete